MTAETKILKVKDPSLDSNDWPILTLTDVEVCDQATRKRCSLLEADSDRLLTITGLLPRSKGNTRQLLNRKLADSLPTAISVQDIRTFSYGQDDEGNVLLWAAGEAGWFEIKPSRRYEPTFKSDREAVNVLYFLADLYQEFKGKHRQLGKLSVESIFQQYAEDPLNNCSTAAHAEAAFHRHKTFLVNSMKEGKEGINWKQTALLSYLRDQEDVIMVDSPSGYQTPARLMEDPRSQHAGKGRSSLRPRALKGSGKGTAGTAGTAFSESEDVETVDSPYGARPSKSLKRKRTPSSVDEDGDSEGASPPSPAKPAAPLPLRGKSKATSKPRVTSVKISKERVPSTKANGYGDTWTCTVDGCAARVYAASTPESKALIAQHFQSHANDRQVQLDLVFKEERPYLPVSNLVNKIRELAAQQQARPGAADPSAPGLDSAYPKPIAQKY